MNYQAIVKQDVAMPAMDLTSARQRHQAIVEFARDILREGVDYGTIPGTPKPTLFKPGAEKLTTFFGLQTRINVNRRIEQWEPEPGQSEAEFVPFFFYEVEVDFYYGPTLVTTGVGSCNSKENRYAWRWVAEDQVPAHLDKHTLAQRGGKESEFDFAIERKQTDGQWGKPAEVWLQWERDIAEGRAVKVQRTTRKGKSLVAWERDSITYRIPNEDIFTQVNTLLKMAVKRAYVDGCLRAVNASEFFTQDVEDLDFGADAYVPVVEARLVEDEPAGRDGTGTDETGGEPVVADESVAEVVHDPSAVTAAPGGSENQSDTRTTSGTGAIEVAATTPAFEVDPMAEEIAERWARRAHRKHKYETVHEAWRDVDEADDESYSTAARRAVATAYSAEIARRVARDLRDVQTTEDIEALRAELDRTVVACAKYDAPNGVSFMRVKGELAKAEAQLREANAQESADEAEAVDPAPVQTAEDQELSMEDWLALLENADSMGALNEVAGRARSILGAQQWQTFFTAYNTRVAEVG